jgi:hypothetical protein
MGVFTPVTNSPNHFVYGDREPQLVVTSRPGDRTESAPDLGLDLDAVLLSLAPLPPYSALVGICDDGLPLLLDLKNPASGSILMVGDPAAANRPLLRSLLASAVILNTVEEVQLYLITSDGADFAEFQEVPGALEIINPHEPEVLELIWHLTCRAQQQPYGRQAQGVEVMLIEDLEALTAQLDPQVRSELDWLVEVGPQAGVWVIAVLDAARLGEICDSQRTAFRTQLMDAVDRGLLEAVAGAATEMDSELDPGAQYCARRAGDAIPFWLPRYTYITQPEKRVVKGTT